MMKEFVLILLAVFGILLAAAPETKAGVSIGIGVGFPGAYYCPPYPYGYYPYYPAYRPALRVGYYSPYYWWHGRRYYNRRHHWR